MKKVILKQNTLINQTKQGNVYKYPDLNIPDDTVPWL